MENFERLFLAIIFVVLRLQKQLHQKQGASIMASDFGMWLYFELVGLVLLFAFIFESGTYTVAGDVRSPSIRRRIKKKKS